MSAVPSPRGVRAVAAALAMLAASSLAGCVTPPPSRGAAAIVSAPGPLPLTRSFRTTSSRQTLFVSASAWAEHEDVRLEVQVLVDGAVAGRCRLFSNGPAEHRTLVCPAIPLLLAPGPHEIELRAGNDDTVTDPEDLFEVLLVEE